MKRAPMVVLLGLVVLMTCLSGMQTVLLSRAHAKWAESHELTERAIAGWEASLKNGRDLEIIVERNAATARTCLTELQQAKR